MTATDITGSSAIRPTITLLAVLLAATANAGGVDPRCDFDGDGRGDLAVGVPSEGLGDIDNSDAGVVNVIYGTGSGLASSGDQVWHQDVGLIEGAAENDDRFGSALACGDFDNDGRDDLAVGAPFEAIGSLIAAGAVNVIYGTSSGLDDSGDQIWHQDSMNINGQASKRDQFGYSLTVGDFNGDNRDDLAIGVPFDSVDGADEAGYVNVIYGSSGGLDAAGDQLFSQDTTGISSSAEARDNFGLALTAGDFDNDGFDDLAVGVPGESVAESFQGAVNVIYGSASGLVGTDSQYWHQDVNLIEGAAEAQDHFGRALTTGDFNCDGIDDLAIGVPGEDVGSIRDAGAVNVIYGSAAGLATSGDQLWHQDVDGVNGGAGTIDAFGKALAAGDFDDDNCDDLAIGVPGDDPDAAHDGAVNVLYGDAGGLTASGDQRWSQGSSGIKGAPENGDNFGAALAVSDFDGDGYEDLAVGKPGESLDGNDDAGGVNIIYGSSSGLTSVGDQNWSQDSQYIEFGSEEYDAFGAALAVGRGR